MPICFHSLTSLQPVSDRVHALKLETACNTKTLLNWQDSYAIATH